MRARSPYSAISAVSVLALALFAGEAQAEPPRLATILDPTYAPSEGHCEAEPSPECLVDLARSQLDAITKEEERIYVEAYAWAALNIAGKEESRAAAKRYFAEKWPFQLTAETPPSYLWVIVAAAAEAGLYDQARVAANLRTASTARSAVLAHTAWRESQDCHLNTARATALEAETLLGERMSPMAGVFASSQVVKGLYALDSKQRQSGLVLQMRKIIADETDTALRDSMLASLAIALVWSGEGTSAKATLESIDSGYKAGFEYGQAARAWAKLGDSEAALDAVHAAERANRRVSEPDKRARIQAHIAPVLVYLRNLPTALDYAMAIDDPREKARALERIVHAAWDPRDRPGLPACV